MVIIRRDFIVETISATIPKEISAVLNPSEFASGDSSQCVISASPRYLWLRFRLFFFFCVLSSMVILMPYKLPSLITDCWVVMYLKRTKGLENNFSTIRHRRTMKVYSSTSDADSWHGIMKLHSEKRWLPFNPLPTSSLNRIRLEFHVYMFFKQNIPPNSLLDASPFVFNNSRGMHCTFSLSKQPIWPNRTPWPLVGHDPSRNNDCDTFHRHHSIRECDITTHLQCH